MEDRTVELRIPARTELIALTRLVVSTLALTRRELDEERVDDLKLAVSEAVTNAIESYGTDVEGKAVTVFWTEQSDKLEVRIQDVGKGFDLSRLAAHPPVTDSARLQFERGLGIPLIRSLVDEALFEPSEDGTSVCLSMYCGSLSYTGDPAAL